MTSPNAAKGRALLEKWRVDHSERQRERVILPARGGGIAKPVCLCGHHAPCPTARLIAALEEALEYFIDGSPRERAVLAKLETPE